MENLCSTPMGPTGIVNTRLFSKIKVDLKCNTYTNLLLLVEQLDPTITINFEYTFFIPIFHVIPIVICRK